MNEKTIPCSWCRASLRADAKTCASCGAPVSPPPQNLVTFARALPPGTLLRGGDYTIQNVIAQGRFGITYRALNHRLNRAVAIKEWFPSTCERDGVQVLAGPNLGEREFEKGRAAFLAEARGLAQFEHPAIVSLFAVWEENRSAYMEMELLHGPTLAQVLARFHHLKTEDALRLFAPLLEALQQLHAQNWLHRDFNPHNIVLRDAAFEAKDATNCVQQSRAVLIDFGASRQIAPDISQEFSVLVTPGYAPLEQYARRARRGAYSDIYALCATLYHALSGQIPPAAADRATGAKLVPLRDLAPAVPEMLCRAIESGLQTEIANRPQTVRQLRELLPPLPARNVLQAPPQVLAAPVSLVAPVEKAPQVLAAPFVPPVVTNAPTDKRTKNMLVWLGVGPFGFALLLGVLFSRPQVEPNWSAPATRWIDEPNADEPLPPSAEPLSYPSLFDNIPPWQMQGKIAQSVFSSTGNLAGIEEQQDKGAIRIWNAKDGRVLHSLGTLSEQRTAQMAFSPDGKLLAIREVAPPSPPPRHVASGVNSLRSKNSLASGKNSMEEMQKHMKSARELMVKEMRTRQQSEQKTQERASISVFDVKSGQRLWKREMLANRLQWSPDSSDLLLHVAAPNIKGCAARSGQEFTHYETMPFQVASADATWFADYNSQTVRGDYRDKSDGWQWKLDADERLGSLTFAPDNSWVMGLGYYGTGLVSYTQGEDLAQNYAATHSGGRVWFFDLQTGKVINVWSGTMAKDEGASFGTFFSPRGRYVGIWRFDNVLRVWEVRTHRDFAFRWPASLTTNESMRSPDESPNLEVFDWRSSAFSPDENQIVLSGESRHLWLVNLSARTIHKAQLPLPASGKLTEKLPNKKSVDVAPISIKASFTADNQYIVWLDPRTGQMGRLSVDDFNQKVPVEIIDGATSQPS